MQTYPSLYRYLKHRMGSAVPNVRLTKLTLVHLSHTLEDIVLRERLPALMFTGFQESRYWSRETNRYLALADVARQVCIFAGRPLPADHPATALQVTLDDGDPLRQEWFLAILSPKFAVVLAGLDTLLDDHTDDATRTFDTLWSFEGPIVDAALDIVEEALAYYDSDKLATLRAARVAYPTPVVDPALFTSITLEMLRFEVRLHQREASALVALRQSEARYRLLAENASDIISLHTLGGVCTYTSAAIEPVLGYTPDEMVNASPFMGELFHPEDLPSVQASMGRLLTETNPNITVTYRMRHRQGHYVWVESQLCLVRQDGDPMPQMLAITRDITQRREAEQQATALAVVRERNQLITRFIEAIAHEFSTPLSVINLNAALLARAPDDERRQRAIQTILAQSAAVQALVSDMQALGRLERSEATRVRPDEVGALLRDLLTRYGPSALERGITLRLDLPDGQVWAHISAELLFDAVGHLLKNALQHTPSGGSITLSTEATPMSVLLRVADTGEGIPPDALPHVTEPFWRTDQSRSVRGAGIGLTLAQRAVMLMGGTLSLESAPHQGTTVLMKLRAALPAAPDTFS